MLRSLDPSKMTTAERAAAKSATAREEQRKQLEEEQRATGTLTTYHYDQHGRRIAPPIK